MVKQNGVFTRKTAQEREMERRVMERKQELLDYYRTRQREMLSSSSKPLANDLRGEEHVAPSGQREGRTDSMTDVSQVSSSLHSLPLAEKRSNSEEFYEKKTPSLASTGQNEGERWLAEGRSHQFDPDQEESAVTVCCRGS